MPAKQVVTLAKKSGAKIVDLRFIDVPGLWQHFSIPAEDLSEDLFEEGVGFDGSSDLPSWRRREDSNLRHTFR